MYHQIIHFILVVLHINEGCSSFSVKVKVELANFSNANERNQVERSFQPKPEKKKGGGETKM